MNHLEILSKSYDGYFGVGELETSEGCIINPYSFNFDLKSVDKMLKIILLNCSRTVFLKCSLNAKLWNKIGAVQWTCFQDFVKKH